MTETDENIIHTQQYIPVHERYDQIYEAAAMDNMVADTNESI